MSTAGALGLKCKNLIRTESLDRTVKLSSTVLALILLSESMAKIEQALFGSIVTSWLTSAAEVAVSICLSARLYYVITCIEP